MIIFFTDTDPELETQMLKILKFLKSKPEIPKINLFSTSFFDYEISDSTGIMDFTDSWFAANSYDIEDIIEGIHDPPAHHGDIYQICIEVCQDDDKNQLFYGLSLFFWDDMEDSSYIYLIPDNGSIGDEDFIDDMMNFIFAIIEGDRGTGDEEEIERLFTFNDYSHEFDSEPEESQGTKPNLLSSTHPIPDNEWNSVDEKPHIFVFYNRLDGKIKERKVNIEISKKLIDTQPTEEELSDNFIGFVSSEPPYFIQFIRLEFDEWYIDIPIFNGDKYTHSIGGTISHSNIVPIISNFAEKGDLFQVLKEGIEGEIIDFFKTTYLIDTIA
ncbi:MAG: hypothetical protein GPJ54_01935 [Candidatus Heimdallarchaeota archaeon]|nr:hypothetical protein [Candidatus Heimdallarchaeota archaeon]